MEALTPAERRGALLVALLLALGAGHDLWRATRPLPTGPGRVAGDAASEFAPDLAPDIPPPGPSGRDADSLPGAPAATDLNRASARELDALPGVGPVLAARIIEYRERHGPFLRVEELMGVRGIGPRLYARLAPRLVVGSGRRRLPPGSAAPATAAPMAPPPASRPGR